MAMRREGMYKGIPSVVLETDRMRAVFLRYGSKLASLIDKKTGREILWQNNTTEAYHIPVYGEDYEKAEFSGWDDMFPQIGKGYYDSFPFEGTFFPDHGEVWSREWQLEVVEDSLSFTIYGVKLPYKLVKVVRFTAENRLEFSYQLQNLCEFDYRYIWSMHPLIRYEAGMRVKWDQGDTKLLIADSNMPHMHFGDTIMPTESFLKDGFCGLQEGQFLKFYAAGGKVPESCYFTYSDGSEMAISYLSLKPINLGFWINMGGKCGQYNIAPEYCSAMMDDFATSKRFESDCILKANSIEFWKQIIEFK